MLTHIHIRDFAIVDRLELDFGGGLSALTGETGAGKSILLDALGLCLGDRAGSDTVRPGAAKAELSVSFSVAADGPAAAWLQEQELEAEEECILRRVIQPGGRSKAYVNGRPMPLQSLRDLGEHLVDIHGQHAHQSLLRREMQRQLLDGFGNYPKLTAKVAYAHGEYQGLVERIEELEGGQQDYESRLDLLRFQVDELSALDMDESAIEELDSEQRRLAAAGELIERCQGLLTSLYEDDGSAHSALGHAASELERLSALDSELGATQELFASALIQLEEGCDNLRRYAEGVELDPARLSWIEERLVLVTDLARKHRVRPEELPARLAQLQEELEGLEGSEQDLLELRRKRDAALERYRAAAAELSEARREAASALNEQVTALIKELGMPGGELRIAIEPQPEGKPSRHGSDQIQFEVRTNPGQPFAPVNRVASGGELSRIGLAIQVATAQTAHIPTLVFDEADTGMGGAVAEVVGRQLQSLGRTHQVLCVTHLPQVAAQAHHQFQVSKHSAGDSTQTQVRALRPEERTEEIARMLGGVEITEHTRNHAQEMLERAQNNAATAAAG